MSAVMSTQSGASLVSSKPQLWQWFTLPPCLSACHQDRAFMCPTQKSMPVHMTVTIYHEYKHLEDASMGKHIQSHACRKVKQARGCGLKQKHPEAGRECEPRYGLHGNAGPLPHDRTARFQIRREAAQTARMRACQPTQRCLSIGCACNRLTKVPKGTLTTPPPYQQTCTRRVE